MRRRTLRGNEAALLVLGIPEAPRVLEALAMSLAWLVAEAAVGGRSRGHGRHSEQQRNKELGKHLKKSRPESQC